MMADSTAVCNPLGKPYKRLVPGYEAPCYIAWSGKCFTINPRTISEGSSYLYPSTFIFQWKPIDGVSCNLRSWTRWY